ncbi:MAG TPA: PadR family transcriptional regulator [Candidatus Nanoarchaeia archaeon]|nr:PadR family transcriptional regulator [Candidatus Nanoarchaeia archaeon]
MRGQLKFIILKQIEQTKCSGYDLMNAVEEKLGQKPSPGSVYPLLDELTHSGLIKKQSEGRRILYELTSKGKTELKRLIKTKDELFKGMERNVRLCGLLFEENVEDKIQMIKQMGKEAAPFSGAMHQIKKEVEELKQEVFRMYASKSLQKNAKKVKIILSKAAKDLKRLQ